jgi:hypothetical protein
MKKFFFLLFFIIFNSHCVHKTAMDDKSLSSFFKGAPLPEQELANAMKNWPNDTVLLNIQQAFSILRKTDLTDSDIMRAKNHLEQAVLTFEDLKQPKNFNQAFSPDSKTPYRGRSYERVLASMLLGIINMSLGKCDMALPSFKAAEFLDARWQALQYASDAPMVYALMLKCLNQKNSAISDIDRAKEGLFRALRINVMLENMLSSLSQVSSNIVNNDITKLALVLMEVGIPSALMKSDKNADVKELLKQSKLESVKFLLQAVKQKDDPFSEMIMELLKKLPKSSKDNLSDENILLIERRIDEIISYIISSDNLMSEITKSHEETHKLAQTIVKITNHHPFIIKFEGKGPTVKSEGEYKEIAKIIPNDQENTVAKVNIKNFNIIPKCGLEQSNGSLTITICNNDQKYHEYKSFKGIKLWSSDYKATHMIGRKFEKVLKGRAQFKLGANTVAIVGAVAAITLLDIGLRSGNNAIKAAAGVAALVATAAFIAGAATNPEADIRHVTNIFEGGYLLVED